ncbi:MAG TPA: hypothetical protein VGA64_10545 [Candidatus Polarisedimenticolia bacterium]
MSFTKNILVTTVMIGLCAGAFAAEPAARGKTKSSVSVGQFAVMVASATGGVRGEEAGKAVDLLSDRGVPLGDSSATLTERKLAEIMDFYGVRATTTNPAGQVSSSRAQAAAILIASSDLGRTSTAGFRGPTTQTLNDCAALANHGQCVNCCKTLGTSGKQCAQFCMTINKPSASEPIP